MSTPQSDRTILVTGATGSQGSAVVKSLLDSTQFNILAVSRNPASPKAKALAANPRVKVVQGDLDDMNSLFAAIPTPWGVFSVQPVTFGVDPTKPTASDEYKQGTALIDASVAAGVSFFVYTSGERGGDEPSWEIPTDVGFMSTKHAIEHYLRDNAGDMGYAILRPVGFMDNLLPGMQNRAFLGLVRSYAGDNRYPWVATTDIGHFARLAFADHEKWNHRAVGLAGDYLTMDELDDAFVRATGRTPARSWPLGFLLGKAIPDLARMAELAASGGQVVDLAEVKRMYPATMDIETWAAKNMGSK